MAHGVFLFERQTEKEKDLNLMENVLHKQI